MVLDINLNEPYNDSYAIEDASTLNEKRAPPPIDVNESYDDSDVIEDAAILNENRAPPLIDVNEPYDDSDAIEDASILNENRAPPPIDVNEPYNDFDAIEVALTLNENRAPPSLEEDIFEDVAEGDENLSDNGGEDEDISYMLSEGEGILSGMLSEEGHVVDEPQASVRKLIFLDNNKRRLISELLKSSTRRGKLLQGVVKRVASYYSVSINVIYGIWRQVKEEGEACHKKTKNCGRKRVQIDFERMRNVPLARRRTLRSLQIALGLKTKTTLLKYIEEGTIRGHSSALKPHLKDDNMKRRLEFCLSMLEDSSIPHDPMFKSMHNIVHIDEKWFYMTRKSTNYYLLEDEDEPYRTCKNKNYISKVMFLTVVARPRFDDTDNVIFLGKIGLFPMVNKVPAQRSSANRRAGTLETKPITSITQEVNRMFLINKVLPAIKEKWPRDYAHETIYIQQDNAPSHVSINDEEFRRAASEGGFDIRLICQPPNSPDLNVLDLGFFAAIQSLQQNEVTNSVDSLIQVVEKTYNDFSTISSNNIFLSLQQCMIEIMKCKGSNNYKVPHMKKEMLLNRGMLPTQLKCDRELFQETFEYLHNV